ncbi:MAG: CDP-alcohol phosphatidyltransferase family protein [Bacilli bacterium]|nr:CDP-alcohol phosphatidyltransferase family protein [Bacilli bacterium]
MGEVTNKIKEKFIDFINEGKDDFKKIKKPKDLVKQIPNLFTFSRLVLIPFIVANILSGNLLVAGFITLGASVTDLIDGKVARALDATSNFGANLDAIIDKIFITSITIPLFFTNPYLIVPILLDMIIASINGYAHIQDIQTKTSKVGKVKTASLDTLICSSFFTNVKIIDSISKVLYLSTIGLQLKTANEYYKTYLVDNESIKKNETIKRQIDNELDIGESKTIDKELTKITLKKNKIDQLNEFKDLIINHKELDEKRSIEEKLKVTKK